MGKIAMIFAGQGAQRPGMAKEYYDHFASVRDLFAAAENIRPGITEICFNGTPEDLKKTEITQPCLYLTDLAGAIALKESGVHAAVAAGFSLGEIPALAFAGAYSYEEGFRIVCERGKMMAASVVDADTTMAAVLKLKNHIVEQICEKHTHIYPVNYNCPGQLTVAGLRSEFAAFGEDVKAAGGRMIELAVSGAFHSPYMNQAAEGFASFLDGCEITAPTMPVYANYTASLYGDDPTKIRENMGKQIHHPVKWEQIIRNMAADGVDMFLEVGVGNVLTKLVSKIVPDAVALAVDGMAGIEKAKETL